MLQRLRITLIFLLALMVLSGTARAGTRYFSCSMTGGTLAEACCAAHATHDSRAPAIRKATHACCEAHVVGDLPVSTLQSSARIAPPSVALAINPFEVACQPETKRASSFFFVAHPPNPPNARSRTVVFLI